MPADKLNIQTPGATANVPTVPNDDASAARIAELESTVAQQAALISDLNGKLQGLETVPARAPNVDAGPRLIGVDWSSMTAAEAQAKGCTMRVLCSDGYFIPA